jgi:hypothetical protein
VQGIGFEELHARALASHGFLLLHAAIASLSITDRVSPAFSEHFAATERQSQLNYSGRRLQDIVSGPLGVL